MDFSQSYSKLRFVLHVHFVLVVGVLLTHWSSPAYLFYNVLFVVAIIWSIASRNSVEASQIAFSIDLSSFFFDLFIIAFNMSGIIGRVLGIVNLLFRFYSMKVLHTEMLDREPSLLEFR
ncbi:CLUMA_CG017488, isoform A [Clunio marinus]|uniref:CLUMA_CG017488, isoform A n=1 Tax=Clunio marinus TaxID=568069 RepID=A0A1J1IXG2_9DIPT|nr:CLUMA_CG017488, isoform A [Clunio marinus]